jgi:predicted AAA+ superfamily ATPase
LPTELAGRDEIIERVSIQLDRCRNGLAYRSFLMVGLRGVGKTVLLNHLALNAEAEGFAVILIETPEKRSLPALIVPALRSALLKLDRLSATGDLAKNANSG